MDLTPAEIKYKRILLELMPPSGDYIGNQAVRKLLIEKINNELGETITPETYWKIRDSLLEDGKVVVGGGKGGSVALINAPAPAPSLPAGSHKYDKETSLYEPIRKTIEKDWASQYRIKDFVCEITANAGKRDRGNWTRPDITLFAVRTYPYLPGRFTELITFEIKKLNTFSINGVFETAAHSAYAHRSYLMIHYKNYDPKKDNPRELERVISEAERMNIGLIVFDEPDDVFTWVTLVKAPLLVPDPDRLTEFINEQLNEKNKESIREKVK
jgi:hypothetical protein